jgi:DNA-binding beta-propeller fold protein YncE
LVTALLVIVASLSFPDCSKSTKPKVVKYNLYVGATHLYTSPEDSSTNRIYIYDTDSLNLLDSISRAHYINDLAASSDGRWLYVVDFPTQSPTLWKIDARTKNVVWSRSGFGGYLRFLADGKLLLVGNSVLRPDDDTILRHMDDSLRLCWGPESGTKVAAVTMGDGLLRLCVTDVVTGESHGSYVPRLSSGDALQAIYAARLHRDGRRVLAIGLYGGVNYSWFVVGDIETGQTLFQHSIYRPQGEVAISGDGNLAAVTDPGTAALGEYGHVYLVNLRTLSFITPSPPIEGAQVRFLPGDQKIVTAPSSSGAWASGPVNVIDVATMKLEKMIWPMGEDSPDWPNIGALSVGPRP